MEKEFFTLHYDHPFSSSSMPTWQSLSSALELPSPDCFLSTQPPTTTNDNFESALSSMASSPAASNTALSNDNFMIRELIGKLGNICNSGDISSGNNRHAPPPYIGGSTNNSCYSTPLSSPPKMGSSIPIVDHLVKENLSVLGNSIPLGSNLPAMPGDPGFAERAARFSSFGSRSFNGRTSQYVANNHNQNHNHNLVGNGKLQRVASSPSLKEAGSRQAQKHKSASLLQNNKQGGNCDQEHAEFSNSLENSTISGQNPVGENGSSRKRKAAAPKGKTKEIHSQTPLSTNTVAQNGEDSSGKRAKSEEGGSGSGGEGKAEKNRGDASQKPPEPPKDYIHVRARRGQATDSHSLAERVRREKISERMKLLQDLVPGCDKVTGKALMLDEIINYVQSLQRQVEFLSMKLASVNPRLELNIGDLFSKDVIQQNCSMQHPMYPLDSMAPDIYGQPHQNPLPYSIPTTAPCRMDPLNSTINHNRDLHLPSLDGFPNALPQQPSLCEGDLQSVVQMGFGQKDNGFLQPQTLHGSNPSPLMKMEF